MKFFLRFILGIYWVYAAILFLVMMLLVFPFVVISSFFGKIRGGNMIYRICRIWDDAWLFMVGIRHRNIFEAPLDKDKSYVFVANHNSYMDIPTILQAIRKKPFRVLGKSEIRNIPIFGYIYGSAVVMVNRSDAANRSHSVRITKSVLRKNISMVIFPEGTFNETDKPLKHFFDGAFRIAIEMQVPIVPILFLDAYARMSHHSFFSLNPGRSRAVFLEEIPVEGLTMQEVGLLKRKVHAIMEEKLIAYQASWIGKKGK